MGRSLSTCNGVPYQVVPDDEILKIYLSGKSIPDVARMLHVRRKDVRSIVEKYDVKHFGTPRTYHFNQESFSDAENNPEAAYWVGFLMADGSIRQKNTLVLALSERDKDHIDKFRKFLGTSTPIKRKICNGFGEKTGNYLAYVAVCSAKMTKDLSKYGITQNKTLSAEVKLLENNPHFWRGAVDGDGCLRISRTGGPGIHLCGSKKLITQFSNYAASIVGHPVKYQIEKCKNLWYCIVSCSKAVALVTNLYGDSICHLDRKKEIADNIMKWVPSKTKTSAEIVVFIWNSYHKEKMEFNDIVKKYNVDRGIAWRIIHRKSWINITDKLIENPNDPT